MLNGFFLRLDDRLIISRQPALRLTLDCIGMTQERDEVVKCIDAGLIGCGDHAGNHFSDGGPSRCFKERFREEHRGNTVYEKFKKMSMESRVMQSLYKAFARTELLKEATEQEFAEFLKEKE